MLLFFHPVTHHSQLIVHCIFDKVVKVVLILSYISTSFSFTKLFRYLSLYEVSIAKCLAGSFLCLVAQSCLSTLVREA
jgi:hypothetical protein